MSRGVGKVLELVASTLKDYAALEKGREYPTDRCGGWQQ
jgi:hypothetical protein